MKAAARIYIADFSSEGFIVKVRKSTATRSGSAKKKIGNQLLTAYDCGVPTQAQMVISSQTAPNRSACEK